jgi:hypothetical protein
LRKGSDEKRALPDGIGLASQLRHLLFLVEIHHTRFFKFFERAFCWARSACRSVSGGPEIFSGGGFDCDPLPSVVCGGDFKGSGGHIDAGGRFCGNGKPSKIAACSICLFLDVGMLALGWCSWSHVRGDGCLRKDSVEPCARHAHHGEIIIAQIDPIPRCGMSPRAPCD